MKDQWNIYNLLCRTVPETFVKKNILQMLIKFAADTMDRWVIMKEKKSTG